MQVFIIQAFEVIAFHRKLQEDKGGDDRFIVDDNHFSDFEQFLKQYFPDQTVYVDLWATWCVPCKEEFQFSDQLHNFVDSRGISVLYISLDKDVDENIWKEMITYYDLKRYHIRAPASLLSNLQKRIYKSDALTIPRYILVRNDKVLEEKMKRPSTINRLYT